MFGNYGKVFDAMSSFVPVFGGITNFANFAKQGNAPMAVLNLGLGLSEFGAFGVTGASSEAATVANARGLVYDAGASVAKSGDYINLASQSRTSHIIAGDTTGGRHAWFGSGKSFINGLTGSKSMFPIGWSNSKIMHRVSEVVISNPWVQQTGRAGAMFTRSGQPVRFVTEGFYDGIKIRVINIHSEIITAFPIR